MSRESAAVDAPCPVSMIRTIITTTNGRNGMQVSRRALLASAAAAAFAATISHGFAQSDWKPNRDVEFVIPFAVGGGADLMARVIHKIITEEKLVPVPVALVNRPGGGGAVGVGYVAA